MHMYWMATDTVCFARWVREAYKDGHTAPLTCIRKVQPASPAVTHGQWLDVFIGQLAETSIFTLLRGTNSRLKLKQTESAWIIFWVLFRRPFQLWLEQKSWDIFKHRLWAVAIFDMFSILYIEFPLYSMTNTILFRRKQQKSVHSILWFWRAFQSQLNV